MRLCETEKILSEAIEYTNCHQKYIKSGAKIGANLNKSVYNQPAEIVISKKRSFEAASTYAGQKVCVHNFASATTPGGGVTKGSSAQEEALCRCSTLFKNLAIEDAWNEFYAPNIRRRNAFHTDDCIYSPDVVVFKTDTAYPALMRQEYWFKVNVVTCAAPNLRKYPSNRMNVGDGSCKAQISDASLRFLHERRLRRILDVALKEGNEVVILGAFGCGAFQNPPAVVAQAMRTVIEEYKFAFKIIELAIYCRHKNDTNYKTFLSIFNE